MIRREWTRLWRAARRVLLYALLVFSAVYSLIAIMIYLTSDAMSLVDVARYAAIATLYLIPSIILLGILATHILYMVKGDHLLIALVVAITSLLGIARAIAGGSLVGLLTLSLVLAPLLPSLAALQGIVEIVAKKLPRANRPVEETMWKLLALFSTPAALGVSMLFARLYFTRIQVLQLVDAIAAVAAIAYFGWRSEGRGTGCRPALYTRTLALAAAVAGIGAAAGIPVVYAAAAAVVAASAFAALMMPLAGRRCSVLRHHTLAGTVLGEAALQAVMALAVLLPALDMGSAAKPLRLLGAGTSPGEVLTRLLVAASLVQAAVLSYVYAALWHARRRCGGVTVS